MTPVHGLTYDAEVGAESEVERLDAFFRGPMLPFATDCPTKLVLVHPVEPGQRAKRLWLRRPWTAREIHGSFDAAWAATEHPELRWTKWRALLVGPERIPGDPSFRAFMPQPFVLFEPQRCFKAFAPSKAKARRVELYFGVMGPESPKGGFFWKADQGVHFDIPHATAFAMREPTGFYELRASATDFEALDVVHLGSRSVLKPLLTWEVFEALGARTPHEVARDFGLANLAGEAPPERLVDILDDQGKKTGHVRAGNSFRTYVSSLAMLASDRSDYRKHLIAGFAMRSGISFAHAKALLEHGLAEARCEAQIA